MPESRSLRFVSANPYKVAEVTEILGEANIRVVAFDRRIEELQTNDSERLVRDKLLKAFRHLGRPLFVEHTGLELAHLNGLPGGLTQIFWDTLEADKFATLFGSSNNDSRVVARTTLAYCDGKTIHIFRGSVDGIIVNPPRGNRSFQWDCVFQPDGQSETFAEMGTRKNEISMRRKALDALMNHLMRGG